MESDSIFHNPYIEKLLSAEIRLWEIPKEELRGAMAWEIYLSAFRADRALSKSYYETDLCLLKEEIEQARKTTDFSFTHCLERLYEDKRSEYELVYRLKKDPMLKIKADIQKGQYFSISADEKTALRRTQGNLK